MDQLKRYEQDDLAAIRQRDATARHESKAESAIAELEWKLSSFMISAGLILGPIIAVLVVIAVVWIWLF